MLQIRLTANERNVYTYMLNLSKGKAKVAFAKTITIALHCQISVRTVNKILKKLQELDLIFCIDCKKKVRYWRVFEIPKLCISKKRLEEMRQKPARIRRKIYEQNCSKLGKIEHVNVPQLGTLGSPSMDLRFPKSGERIESITKKNILKEYPEKNTDFFPQLNAKKKDSLKEKVEELKSQYGEDAVNAKIAYIQAKGYCQSVRHAYSYLKASLETDRLRALKREQMLGNRKRLEPKLQDLVVATPYVGYFLGKTCVILQETLSGKRTKIALDSSEDIVNMELRFALAEMTNLNVRI